MENNRRIEAIKRYRELTGASLKDTREMMEYLEKYPDAALSKPSDRLSAESATPFDAGVRELIKHNKNDEAIEAYQEFTGATFSEAETKIERIAWEIDEREKRSNG